MLNYNSPINDTKNCFELRITEIEPIIKINLRGKKRDFITQIGKSLSIIPPTEPNTASGNERLNIIWLSPDEWMIYSNEKINSIKNNYNLEDKLFNEISKVKLGSVTNVTDQWVMINLNLFLFISFLIFFNPIIIFFDCLVVIIFCFDNI